MTNEMGRTVKCDMELPNDTERKDNNIMKKMTDVKVRNEDLKRKYSEEHILSKKLCLSFQNENIAVMHELDNNPSSSINMFKIPKNNFPLDIAVRSAIINLYEISKPITPNQMHREDGEDKFSCKIAPDFVDIEMPDNEISLRIPVSQINKVQCHVRKNLLQTKKSNFIIFFYLDSSAYAAVESSFSGYQDDLFNETASSGNHNILTIVPEKITKGVLRKMQNDIKNMFLSMYEEIDMEEAIQIIKSQRGKTDPNFPAQTLLPRTPSPTQPFSPSNLLPVSSFDGNSHLILGTTGLPANRDNDGNSIEESGDNRIEDEPKNYGQIDFNEEEMNINSFNSVDNRLNLGFIKREDEEEEGVLIKEEDVKCEIEEETPDLPQMEDIDIEAKTFSLECSEVRIGSYLATQNNTTSLCTINPEDGEKTIQLCLQVGFKTQTFDIPHNQIDMILTHFGYQKKIWLYLKSEACLRIWKALIPTQEFWPNCVPENERKVTIISPMGYTDHVKKLILITKTLRVLFGERFSELKKHEANILLNETTNDKHDEGCISELSNAENMTIIENVEASLLTENSLDFDVKYANMENVNAISIPILPNPINGFQMGHNTGKSLSLLKNHKGVLWAQSRKQKAPVDNRKVNKEKLKESFLCQSIRIGSFSHTSTSTLRSTCDIVNNNIEINLPNSSTSGSTKVLKISCNHVIQVLGFFGKWQALFIFLNDEACSNIDKELSLNGGVWPEIVPAGERHLSIIPDKNSWTSSGTTHQERVTNLGQLFSGKLKMIDMDRAATMQEQNWKLSRNRKISGKERKIMPSTPISTQVSKVTPITYPKPDCTYRCLTALAILSSSSGCVQVTNICEFISTHFPYFESYRKPKNLKNVIQTTLCKQRCFTNILTPGSSSINGQLPPHIWGISSSNPWNFTDVNNMTACKKPPSKIKEFVELLTEGIKKGMSNPHLLDQWLKKSYLLTSNVTSTNNVLTENSSSNIVITSSSNIISATKTSPNKDEFSNTLHEVPGTNVNQHVATIESHNALVKLGSDNRNHNLYECTKARAPTANIDESSVSSDKCGDGEVHSEGSISSPLGVITIDVFSIRFGYHELSSFQSVRFGGQPCQFVVTQSSVTIGVPTQGDIGHPNNALNLVNVPITGIVRVDAYVGKIRQLLFLHLVPSTGDLIKNALAIKTSEPLELISIIPVKGRKTSKSSLGKWFSQFKPSFGNLLQEIDLPQATSMLKGSQDYKKQVEETSS